MIYKNIIFFLFIVLCSLPVFSEEEILPRPSEEEIRKLIDFYKKAIDIPPELKGLWISNKVPDTYLDDPDRVVEAYHFCEKQLAKRDFTRFMPNDKTDHYVKYKFLTNYTKALEKGLPVNYITLRPAHWNDRLGSSFLTYYPVTKQLKINEYVHGKLLRSVEFFYSKCPSDKK